MYFAISILAATALAAPVLESRHKTMHMKLAHNKHVTSIKNIVAKGHARIASINGAATGLQTRQDGTITNDDVSYLAPISIGGTTYNLIVDTGSSNLWCGAQNSCEPSSSGQDTGNTVSVSYGSGSMSGEEYTDTVSFGGLTVNSQSVGGATQSSGFTGVDGIIGFGPVDLTQNTVSNTNEVPTFMDNLYSQGSISQEILGVYFAPESGGDTDDANGELTLGGTDSSKYSGSLDFYPVLSSSSGQLAANYWGLSISQFSFGGSGLGSGAGIIDTGTTLIYIPTDVYNSFLSASGGSTDSSSGLSSFSTAPTANFGISFGGQTFTLTPDQYLVPQDQYSEFGLTSGKYYSWINDGGSSGGASGVDCIIGQKFLENYYSAFDTTNSQIGFAPRT